jgi:dUTP pyrophosphatase
MSKLKIETKIVNNLIGDKIPFPSYATDGAAGMDLRACINEPVKIKAGETKLIGSGIAISIRDANYYALLVPRSGLGIKHGIVLANTIGIIDSCYQGEIRIGILNRSNEDFTINQGDRICQMLFLPVQQIEFEIVNEFREKTERGIGGFGHTGLI